MFRSLVKTSARLFNDSVCCTLICFLQTSSGTKYKPLEYGLISDGIGCERDGCLIIAMWEMLIEPGVGDRTYLETTNGEIVETAGTVRQETIIIIGTIRQERNGPRFCRSSPSRLSFRDYLTTRMNEVGENRNCVIWYMHVKSDFTNR